MSMYTVYGTVEYQEWFEEESAKSKLQIQARLSRIRNDGHFGTMRHLHDQLWELKFNDGRRLYYLILPEKKRNSITRRKQKWPKKRHRQSEKNPRGHVKS